LEALLQLSASQGLLGSPFCDEFPKFVIATQLQLLGIHSFDANDKRDWLAVACNNDTLMLSIIDASI
jgi:hypothetical protein